MNVPRFNNIIDNNHNPPGVKNLSLLAAALAAISLCSRLPAFEAAGPGPVKPVVKNSVCAS